VSDEYVDPFQAGPEPVEPKPEGPKAEEPEPLPDDIELVWGQGRLDSNGMLAADTARYLIGEWGLERFRTSAIHNAALGDVAHVLARADARSDFRKRDLPKSATKPGSAEDAGPLSSPPEMRGKGKR